MESSELISGHLGWWLAGGALVLLLLLAPRLRRGRDRRPVAPAAEPKAQGTDLGADAPSTSARTSASAPAAPQATASTGASPVADGGSADGEKLEMDNAMRLEVARVYMELDDAEGAEAMLRQVVEEGDDDEREAAEAMRRRMSGAKAAADDDAPPPDAENLLDLATAYVEIGDTRQARLTIEQIEKVGSEAQREQARALRDRLAD